MTRPACRPALRVPLSAALLLLVAVTACSTGGRAAVAARATVQTFYSAMQIDNVGILDANIAATASPAFRDRVRAATAAAQTDDQARRAVTLVRVDAPVISGNTAMVPVVCADGVSDSVSLVREGPRWKILRTGRLGP